MIPSWSHYTYTWWWYWREHLIAITIILARSLLKSRGSHNMMVYIIRSVRIQHQLPVPVLSGDLPTFHARAWGAHRQPVPSVPHNIASVGRQPRSRLVAHRVCAYIKWYTYTREKRTKEKATREYYYCYFSGIFFSFPSDRRLQMQYFSFCFSDR